MSLPSFGVKAYVVVNINIIWNDASSNASQACHVIIPSPILTGFVSDLNYKVIFWVSGSRGHLVPNFECPHRTTVDSLISEHHWGVELLSAN